MSHHMSLGEVIEMLKQYDRSWSVEKGFGAPASYRGSYDEVAFAPATWATVGNMLDDAMSAVGATFTGYKGGEYTMDRDTKCHIANWGECSCADPNPDELTTERLTGLLQSRARVGQSKYAAERVPATPMNFFEAVEPVIPKKAQDEQLIKLAFSARRAARATESLMARVATLAPKERPTQRDFTEATVRALVEYIHAVDAGNFDDEEDEAMTFARLDAEATSIPVWTDEEMEAARNTAQQVMETTQKCLLQAQLAAVELSKKNAHLQEANELLNARVRRVATIVGKTRRSMDQILTLVQEVHGTEPIWHKIVAMSNALGEDIANALELP